MALPLLVKVEWENGDVTIERPIMETDDGKIYQLDMAVNNNVWAYKSMCIPYVPVDNIVDIKLNQLFTVEGKKYLVVRPETATQTDKCNDHGHIVITLFDMD